MDRSKIRNAVGLVAGSILLVALAGCAADRSGPQVAPTAARPCPPWVEFPADTHSNEDSIYLGCTSALNLRSMVKNPEDLDYGRTLGPANGEHEILGMDAYTQGTGKTPKSAGSAAPAIVLPAVSGGGSQ